VNAAVVFFVVIEVVSAIALVVFVLLHSGRGAGVSEMFGGMMPAASSGSSIVERNLDRLTIASAAVFMVSLVVLMVIYPA
jgi:preprotein translocase subunit SecG